MPTCEIRLNGEVHVETAAPNSDLAIPSCLLSIARIATIPAGRKTPPVMQANSFTAMSEGGALRTP